MVAKERASALSVFTVLSVAGGLASLPFWLFASTRVFPVANFLSLHHTPTHASALLYRSAIRRPLTALVVTSPGPALDTSNLAQAREQQSQGDFMPAT